MENTKKISKIFGLALMTYKQREREGKREKILIKTSIPTLKN
jgi:hypothetical protein